jgi:hypothetical protein
VPDYALYGLVVRSDRALAGLEAAPTGAAPVDVTIALGAGARPADAWSSAAVHYRGPDTADGLPTVEVRRSEDAGFWFRYADGTEFTLDREGTRVAAWWAAASTLEDTATYLLGPVLGFALRLRGVLALHASAVLIDGRAVALVGPSGAGKSTTAAAFAAAGVPVLADDVLAVRTVGDDAMAFPSYRVLRLWEESEQMLFGTVGALPRLTPTWDKRALPLGEDFPFHRAPAPLGDVFLMAPRVDDEAAPLVTPVPRGEALMELVLNTYANYLQDDRMRADELRALEGMLRGRRVRQLVPHADPARLTALVHAVCAAARER